MDHGKRSARVTVAMNFVTQDRFPVWLPNIKCQRILLAVQELFEIVNRELIEPDRKKAIVLDIDDTMTYAATRGPIHPMLALYRWIREHRPDIDLFLSTARPSSYRLKTIRQLNCFGYSGWKELFMVGNIISDEEKYEALLSNSFNVLDPDGKGRRKANVRHDLENQGYTILANVGDDDTDHMYGHYVHAIRFPSI